MASGNSRKRRTPKSAQIPRDSSAGESANQGSPESVHPSKLPTAAPSSVPAPPPLPDHLVNGDATPTPTGLQPPRGEDPQPPALASSPAEELDPQVADFIQQAGPILAIERGINARSRMKLGIIAEDVGLSESQFTAAMARLQGKSPEEPVTPEQAQQRRRRLSAFHNMVGATLMKLPQGLLTSETQRQLVASGSDYGLSAEESSAEISALATKLRVRTISSEEATRHIRDLATMAATEGRIGAPQHQRLVVEGRQWGLTAQQVDAVVDEVMRAYRQSQRSEHLRMVALVTGAAVVLVGVLGVIGWMALMSSFTQPTTASTDSPVATHTIPGLDVPADSVGSSISDTSAATSKPLPAPAWWDADLAAATVKVQLGVPALKSNLVKLRQPDATARRAAYVDLIAAVKKSDAGDDEMFQLSRLLAGAYALEPDESAAAAIAEQLTQLAAGPPDSKPSSYGPYRDALWAAKAGFLALTHEGINQQRQTELATALGRALQTTIDPSAAFLDLNHHVMQSASLHLYGTLAATAHHLPNITVSLHKQLAADTSAYLTSAQADRAETEYLLAILPELGDRWQLYENLLRRCVQSDDPINALKILEVFERTDDRSLQNFLAGQLVLKAGLRDERRTPSELAAAVRGKLGAADLPTAGDSRARYRTWRRLVNDQMLQTAARPTEPARLLEQVVRMAHLSTMGHALALQDVGQPEFEQLSRQGLPELAPSTTEAPSTRAPRRTTREVSSNTLRQVDRMIKTVGNYQRLEGLQRVRAIRSLATYTHAVDDLTPVQAATLAEYLCSKKSVGEHVQVMAAMGQMFDWNNLRLAMADEIDDASLRTENMAELLAKALGHDVKIDAAGRWREQARDELLQSVVTRLGGEVAADAGGATDGVYDKAAAMLFERYRTQAKLASATLPDELAGPGRLTTPGRLLPPLIQAWAAQVSTAASTPADTTWLSQLPQTLVAEEFLASHDLAMTVRNERLLLRLLAWEVARRHGDRAAKADEIVAHVAAQDRSSTHILDQLRQGHEGLLRMWVLINEP